MSSMQLVVRFLSVWEDPEFSDSPVNRTEQRSVDKKPAVGTLVAVLRSDDSKHTLAFIQKRPGFDK